VSPGCAIRALWGPSPGPAISGHLWHHQASPQQRSRRAPRAAGQSRARAPVYAGSDLLVMPGVFEPRGRAGARALIAEVRPSRSCAGSAGWRAGGRPSLTATMPWILLTAHRVRLSPHRPAGFCARDGACDQALARLSAGIPLPGAKGMRVDRAWARPAQDCLKTTSSSATNERAVGHPIVRQRVSSRAPAEACEELRDEISRAGPRQLAVRPAWRSPHRSLPTGFPRA